MGPASETHAVYRVEEMEANESDSEPASTCQGSHCETDPRPKPKRTTVSGKAGASVYRKFNRACSVPPRIF